MNYNQFSFGLVRSIDGVQVVVVVVVIVFIFKYKTIDDDDDALVFLSIQN